MRIATAQACRKSDATPASLGSARATARFSATCSRRLMPTSAAVMPGVERTNWRARWAQVWSAGNAAELRLGVVHVIDVDGRETQVAEASPELVLEIARRHRVPAAHHILGLEDAGAHVGVAHVLAGIDRHAAVEGNVPALGAHDHLLARAAALALEGDQR